jgi:D-beta-D-heptose 7-phosphate kinase/D-beta-D-heptose 1-phosphate adenosyltransferase
MNNIKHKIFCVIGDVIVDHYRIVTPTRISPEAPVMIFDPVGEHKVPGGAANVANNLISMCGSAERVVLFSVVGQDWGQVTNTGFLSCKTRLQYQPDRLTTVKERIVAKNQQIMRIDKQSNRPADMQYIDRLVSDVLDFLPNVGVVIFSDYRQGVMTEYLVSRIITEANRLGVPMVVDSKSVDTIRKYKGSTIALPTGTEAKSFEGMPQDMSLEDTAKYLVKQMKLDAIGLTMGKDGIMFASGSIGPTIYPPLAEDTEEEVVDVTGAGDTVTAAVAMGLSMGWSYDRTIKLANVAAGIVVRKAGVATASWEEIGTTARDSSIDLGDMSCQHEENQ